MRGDERRWEAMQYRDNLTDLTGAYGLIQSVQRPNCASQRPNLTQPNLA